MKRKIRIRTARGPIFEIELCSHKRLQRIRAINKPKRGEFVLGLCEQPGPGKRGRKRKIWINDRQRGWQLCSTAIHELMHAEFPQFDEWAVRRLEASIISVARHAWRWIHALDSQDRQASRKKKR